MKKTCAAGLCFVLLFGIQALGQVPTQPFLLSVSEKGECPATLTNAAPLQKIAVARATGGSVTVRDGEGRLYFTAAAKPATVFTVGGSLGRRIVTITQFSPFLKTWPTLAKATELSALAEILSHQICGTLTGIEGF